MIFECLELSMSQVKKSHQVKNQILTIPKSPKHFYLLLALCKIQYSFTLRIVVWPKPDQLDRFLYTLDSLLLHTVWLISFIEIIILSHFSHMEVSLQK